MRPTLHNLQALRGIACLLVVAYHIGGWENHFWSKWRTFHAFRWFGYGGVDLFFVLSGFIIAWAHREQLGQPRHLLRYLGRRLWRIFPVLWASSAIVIAIVALADTANVIYPDWVGDLVYWMLLIPTDVPFRYNGVTWSLNYEILFYLAFGLLILAPRKAAGGLLALWAIAVIGSRLAGWVPASSAMKLVVSPFVLEFLGGVAVAEIVRRGMQCGPRIAFLLGVAWLSATLWLMRGSYPDDLGNDNWPRVVAFGPASLLFLYAVVAGERTGRLMLPRYFRPIGDASYSIYLMHGPVCMTLILKTWGMNTNFWPHLAWLAMILAGGLGSGWLLYRLVERPLVELARRKSRRPLPCPAVVESVIISSPRSHSSDGSDHASTALPAAGPVPAERLGR